MSATVEIWASLLGNQSDAKQKTFGARFLRRLRRTFALPMQARQARRARSRGHKY